MERRDFTLSAPGSPEGGSGPSRSVLDGVLETAAGIAATAHVASRGDDPRGAVATTLDLDWAVRWGSAAQSVTLATDDL